MIFRRNSINSLIKTPCGRAKYTELSKRKGVFALLRLYWFIVFATLRDLQLTNADQIEESSES